MDNTMTLPNPNRNIVINPQAISTMCQFAAVSQQKPLQYSQFIKFKTQWETFNRVWAYNYTVSSLRGEGAATGGLSYYQFLSQKERTDYANGLLSHIASYPSSVNVFAEPQQN
jgi:hypothetical protein